MHTRSSRPTPPWCRGRWLPYQSKKRLMKAKHFQSILEIYQAGSTTKGQTDLNPHRPTLGFTVSLSCRVSVGALSSNSSSSILRPRSVRGAHLINPPDHHHHHRTHRRHFLFWSFNPSTTTRSGKTCMSCCAWCFRTKNVECGAGLDRPQTGRPDQNRQIIDMI